MKKGIYFLVLISILFLRINAFALNSSNALGSGVKNVLLYYLTPEEEGLSDTLKQDLKATMVYCPEGNCKAQSDNKFMDTYLLLTASAFTNRYCTDNGNGGCNFIQSGIYTEEGYAEYKNQVRRMLGNLNIVAKENNRTVNVILSVAIGDLSGTEDEILNYAKNMAIELHTIYNEVNHSNLNLIGFYWANESISGGENTSNSTKNINVVQRFNEWAHDSNNEFGKAYKTLWIPYMARNTLELNGYSYGFDFVSLQSGHSFNDLYETSSYAYSINNSTYASYVPGSNIAYDPIYRLKLADAIAKSKGFGIEVEYDYRLYNNAKSYNRFMQWLNYALDSGNAWNNSINFYYAESLIMIHKSGVRGVTTFHRDIYDLTYKYAKQKLDKIEVTNLAAGKTYESTTPYSNPESSSGYANSVSGNELTDGNFGLQDLGTEWIAFHTNDAVDGKYYVTIDLGKTYNGLYKFIVDFQKDTQASIGLPNKVEVYYSSDKENWLKYGDLVLAEKSGDIRVEGRIVGDTVSARYIKFLMDTGSKNFVFLSEIQVYKKKAIALAETSGFANEGDTAFKVGLVNETSGSIKVSSSNSSVATAKIGNDGYLYVTPLAEGQAVITVKEVYNNTFSTYNIRVGKVVEVPNTLGGITPLAMVIAMLFVSLGIGTLIYAKRLNDI